MFTGLSSTHTGPQVNHRTLLLRGYKERFIGVQIAKAISQEAEKGATWGWAGEGRRKRADAMCQLRWTVRTDQELDVKVVDLRG